jgi:uncharacterized integral membrane protein
VLHGNKVVMRFVSLFIFVVVTAIIIAFSVKNIGPTQINLWPFAAPLDVATYLVVFVAFLAGFFTGALVAWISGIQSRRKKKRRASDRTATKDGKKSQAVELSNRTAAATNPATVGQVPTDVGRGSDSNNLPDHPVRRA